MNFVSRNSFRWQTMHSVGAVAGASLRAFRWQDSQATAAWTPVSGKRVRSWLKKLRGTIQLRSVWQR